jgi:quinol-cytochrome oxidoreductase complex cytochrome b subunit
LVTTPTGDQVLDSLSFNDSLGWSIFGLCIMIIGLILLGVLMLHFNKLHYLDMGHVGSRKVKLTPSVAEAEDNITAAAAALYGSAETAVVKGTKAATAVTTESRDAEEARTR